MRVRITYSKAEAMQYIGHLDLYRSWERTFRRSGLPLEYSQGFHPQPHINLACALPVGFTSQCEVLDAWLQGEHALPEIEAALHKALPPGIEICGVEVIDEHEPALQTQVLSAVYTITFLDDVAELASQLDRVLSAEHLPRQRRGKSYDLRPLIEEAHLLPPNESGNARLCTRLAAREGATGRPEEFLAELDIQFENTRIHREQLLLANH